MRNLCNIINKMIDEIPQGETELITRLKSVYSSSSCSAPENQYLFWNKTHSILCEFVFGDMYDENNWHENIRKIFIGEIM